MEESQLENVKLNEYDDIFLQHYWIIVFFMKPILNQEFKNVRAPKKKPVPPNPSQKPETELKPVKFKMAHYNLLWLINSMAEKSELTIDGIKVVELQQIRKVFMWYTAMEFKYSQYAGNMAREMYSTGHLESIEGHKTYYYLTPKGKQLLEEIRGKRKESVNKLFTAIEKKTKIKINKKDYKKVLKFSHRITDALWKMMMNEAETMQIPPKESKNSRKPKES